MEAFFHLKKTLPRVPYYIFVLLTHNQINSVLIKPNDEKKAQKTFSINFPKQLLQVCTGWKLHKVMQFQLLHVLLNFLGCFCLLFQPKTDQIVLK